MRISLAELYPLPAPFSPLPAAPARPLAGVKVSQTQQLNPMRTEKRAQPAENGVPAHFWQHCCGQLIYSGGMAIGQGQFSYENVTNYHR